MLPSGALPNESLPLLGNGPLDCIVCEAHGLGEQAHRSELSLEVAFHRHCHGYAQERLADAAFRQALDELGGVAVVAAPDRSGHLFTGSEHHIAMPLCDVEPAKLGVQLRELCLG